METSAIVSPSLHALLLLSDSALPLGSFAFSSGLESFLAHHKQTPVNARLASFSSFLAESIQNCASTALPYVLAAYRDVAKLSDLDNDFDASTPCTVARRASIAQGRALIALWDRAFAASCNMSASAQSLIASKALTRFSAGLKIGNPSDSFGLPLNAHFPPLFGAVCRAFDLGLQDTAYMFLLNHSKAVLSAAVRASVMGPYQSQTLLAGPELQGNIKACIVAEQDKEAEQAAVTIPPMDLWMGRHELLYSRIFNS